MKTTIVIMFTAISISSAVGVDLEKLSSEPAKIEVKGMKPVSLELTSEKKGWIGIPEKLATYGTTIFKPERDQLGVAEFRVIEDGYVLLACNFDYQGNRSGGWTEETLTKEEFKWMGWKEIRKPKKLGGALIQSDKRVQTMFLKKVYKGEYFKLRCNKYDPPYPILLNRERSVEQAAEK